MQISHSLDAKVPLQDLKDKLGKELYKTIYILCGIKDCEVLELTIQPDHVHLVVIAPTKISISALMGHLKGRSAIELYNRFPSIRKKLCSAERLLRRWVRRGRLTEEEASQRLLTMTGQHTDLPYLAIKSLSSKQQFWRFIAHGELQTTPVSGEFSSYGLSAVATVPWF